MKKNLPITDKERTYSQNHRIVSVTDRKGIITYVNKDFIEISGFTEDELYNKNHNIVRHPEMPPEAFESLWDNVKQGKPWMGIVKNRCKNGDFYWVDAYVTPVYENGKISGYQSVRTLPNPAYVERAKSLYQKLIAGKSVKRPFLDWIAGKLKNRLIISHASALIAAFTVLMMLADVTPMSIGSAFMVGLILSISTSILISRPWEKAARRAGDLFENDLARTIYSGRNDELGQIETTIHALQSKLRTVLFRIDDSVDSLTSSAQQTGQVVHDSHAQTEQQLADVAQVATSMNQMSASVSEITQSAEETSVQTENANIEGQKGVMTAKQVLDGMNALVKDVENTASVIHLLKEESGEISTVVDVIRAIAEQTNLLALNAAIEAARAGEQGRGFAVVADEVRTLASRTQQSTGEIQDIVEKLLVRASEAASMMDKSCEQGSKSTELVKAAAEALSNMADAVSNINEMNTHVATATEQQSVVADEIGHSIASINEMAQKTLDSVRVAKQAGENLLIETHRLKATVWQFDDELTNVKSAS